MGSFLYLCEYIMSIYFLYIDVHELCRSSHMVEDRLSLSHESPSPHTTYDDAHRGEQEQAHAIYTDYFLYYYWGILPTQSLWYTHT